jgi:hypothetical protein
MRIATLLAAAFLLAAPAASAQHEHHGAAPAAKAANADHAGCPLHLAGITLTAAQQEKVKAIREAHHAEMAGDSALPDSVRSVRMKASMSRAIADVRALLTPDQIPQFDRLVADHMAMMGKMKPGAGCCGAMKPAGADSCCGNAKPAGAGCCADSAKAAGAGCCAGGAKPAAPPGAHDHR